jgi:hypothetical protein
MFSICLERNGHVRHYSIQQSGDAGWEVKLEADEQLARKDNYRDWHRVERARAVFASEVVELTEHGWQVVSEET